MSWSVYILNARKQFSQIESDLRATLGEAKLILEATTPPIALDIVVQAADYPMQTSQLVGGACYAPGRIQITVDCFRNAPWDDLRDEVLKTFYHEFHHALRWDGPGYGVTLGEALVSEGLAQVFLHEVIQCGPEPWEDMPTGIDLPQLCARADNAFNDASYSHETWFFGEGELPNWTGYALGKALVENHLRLHPGRTALNMAADPAERFRHSLRCLAANW